MSNVPPVVSNDEVWTYKDYLNNKCPGSYIGKPYSFVFKPPSRFVEPWYYNDSFVPTIPHILTQEDVDNELCRPESIGLHTSEIWLEDERRCGLIELSKVGYPKAKFSNAIQAKTFEPVVLPTPTVEQVKQDIKRAYEALGKVDYLKTHLKFFNKLLEQVLCEAPPPQLVQIIVARGETCDVIEPSPNFVEPDEESFLKDDVLQAYQELGGYAYLLDNPRVVENVLNRLIKKPIVTIQSALIIDLQKRVPWMDFANRLSYQRGQITSEVIDVVPRLKDLEPDAKN